MSFSMKLPAAKGQKKKKQYGLIVPSSSTSASSSNNQPRTSFNAFAAASNASRLSAPVGDDGGAADRRKVGAEAARSFHKAQVEQTHAQALAEDPSVFDYDGVYDELQSARAAKRGEHEKAREAERKKPKYITTLLEQAKIREVENERIRERRLLNERKEEDALYGDKEKLVSASYKRKLMEMQRWDEEDKRLEAVEAANDVTKQGEHALAGFYANLMTRNIAMGGDAARATSQYTAGRQREGRERTSKKLRADGEEEEEDKERAQDGAAREPKESGRHQRGRSASLERGEGRREQSRRGDKGDEGEAGDDSTSRQVSEPKPEAPKVETEEPKPSKEDAIAAARARFLARKAQRSAASSSTT